jgi:hypothetical protein
MPRSLLSPFSFHAYSQASSIVRVDHPIQALPLHRTIRLSTNFTITTAVREVRRGRVTLPRAREFPISKRKKNLYKMNKMVGPPIHTVIREKVHVRILRCTALLPSLLVLSSQSQQTFLLPCLPLTNPPTNPTRCSTPPPIRPPPRPCSRATCVWWALPDPLWCFLAPNLGGGSLRFG